MTVIQIISIKKIFFSVAALKKTSDYKIKQSLIQAFRWLYNFSTHVKTFDWSDKQFSTEGSKKLFVVLLMCNLANLPTSQGNNSNCTRIPNGKKIQYIRLHSKYSATLK